MDKPQSACSSDRSRETSGPGGRKPELRAAVKPNAYDGSVQARAQIVLWYHEGHRKTEIAKMSGASRPTIDLWLRRYEEYGLGGLASRSSPGGPRTIPDRIPGRVLALTRQTPPAELGISHWTAGEMARYIRRAEGALRCFRQQIP